MNRLRWRRTRRPLATVDVSIEARTMVAQPLADAPGRAPRGAVKLYLMDDGTVRWQR